MTAITLAGPPGQSSTGSTGTGGADDALAAQWRAFAAMVMRDIRVIKRDSLTLVIRSLVQPLLFVFVFAYVMPLIGQGIQVGPWASAYSTILVPGTVGSSMLLTGIISVTMPLVMELTYTREIEDRLLAPLPAWAIAVEKIMAGAIQALAAGLVVFPISIYVHADGMSPDIHVYDWLLLILVAVAGAVFAGVIGLLFGTLIDPRRSAGLLAVGLLPLTMLGCVYYPWVALRPIGWLKIATLFNPMVYLSEGLRASLTPYVPHLPIWAVLAALECGALAFGWLGIRIFLRKVTL
jgi:ABC-type multidrug transport system permease subunit